MQEKSRADLILQQQEKELAKIKELEEAEKQTFGYRVLKNKKEGYLLEEKRKEIEKEIEITKAVSLEIGSILDESYNTREQLIKDYVKRVSEVHKNANKEELLIFAQGRSNERLRKDLEELIVSEKTLGKAKEATREMIVGSVEWLEKEISALKTLQSQQSTTTEEYSKFQQEIDILNGTLDLLIGKKKELSGITLDLTDNESGWHTEMDMTLNAMEKYKVSLEDLQPLFTDAFNFADVFFQNQINKYDALINKSNEYYDALIANAEDGSAQELALQEEKAKAEEKLQEKKRQAELKAFRFRQLASVAEIAINTAVAVSKVLAQTGVGAAALIPLIIAQGALQTATVLAQQPPAYAEGTDYHKGGDAFVGDGGKREIVQTPDGKLYETPDTTTLFKNMPRGSKVYPDADIFYRNLFKLNFKQKDESLQIEKAIEKGFKKARVNNYVSMPKIDLGHHFYKQKGL
jgi:hypothetical protein